MKNGVLDLNEAIIKGIIETDKALSEFCQSAFQMTK